MLEKTEGDGLAMTFFNFWDRQPISEWRQGEWNQWVPFHRIKSMASSRHVPSIIIGKQSRFKPFETGIEVVFDNNFSIGIKESNDGYGD